MIRRKDLVPQVSIFPILNPFVKKRKMSSEQRTMPNIKFMSNPTDPHLMGRVKEYLAQHAEERQVDIVEMADYLQNKYREYARRKRRPFQAYVQRCYELLLDEYKRQHLTTMWSEEDDDDDEEEVVENDGHQTGSNHLNDGLMKMYQQKIISNSEPINITISSDEDEEPTSAVTITKKTNDTVEKKEVKKIVESRKRKFLSTSLNTSASNPKRKREIQYIEPKVCLNDVGGIDAVMEDLYKLLVHMKYPEIYLQIGVTPPRGFLLHGPPGCGKTLLAHAIAGELSIPLLKVAAPELVAGVSGESEQRIRDLFDQASELAPCILFIDEIDAITPNRQQAQREMERRIVAQLLSSLDALSSIDSDESVLVIGATNRPDAIDPALRRAGRFDREITMGIPNLDARAKILKVLCKDLKSAETFDYEKLASLTPGFVGADLMSLVREAAMAAVERVITEFKTKPKVEKEQPKEAENGEKDLEKTNESVEIIEVVEKRKTRTEELISWLHDSYELTAEVEDKVDSLHIEVIDFEKALKCVQPSAKREGFATVPDVTWDDIGSLNEIREELKLAILAPVRHAKQFELMGLTTATGVLLCGPPGCGKTLLAKAIANEAGINFISVKGPELLNMYVGESERAVRLCFQRARNSAPCVIFFDELDALCPKRSESGENGATMRVVNQMLTEMDGVEGRKGVYLMAASNRPEIVDPAVLRPGRFDKILYVGLPSAADRVDILNALTKNGTRPKMAPEVDLAFIGRSNNCNGYTGADLAALVREASVLALKEYMVAEKKEEDENIVVTTKHFEEAITKIRPSVSDKDQKHYEKLRKLYSACPVEEENEDVQMDDV